MTSTNSEVLVSTDWVVEHKDDTNVRLVEVDVDTSSYESGHIAGAIDWNWTTQLNDEIRRDVLNSEQLATLLGNSGITPETSIILYGDNNNWFAAYAYWQLKMFGHQHLKIVNGGRKKWELEGRAFVKTNSVIKQAAYPVPLVDADKSIRAHQVEVFSALNNKNTTLVDVRSPQEFSGEVIAPPGMTETAQRGGHIPGAVNIPWSKAVNEDGTFKSTSDLEVLYGNAGVESKRDVITYCRIGERSAHTWFILKELLQFPNVKNYDGSWTEWGSMIGVPIER